MGSLSNAGDCTMSKQDTKQADIPASEFGSVIDSELAVLASIEARYWDDLSKLELSAIPSSLKEHLHAQLEESGGWPASLTSFVWPGFTRRQPYEACSARRRSTERGARPTAGLLQEKPGGANRGKLLKLDRRAPPNKLVSRVIRAPS